MFWKFSFVPPEHDPDVVKILTDFAINMWLAPGKWGKIIHFLMDMVYKSGEGCQSVKAADPAAIKENGFPRPGLYSRSQKLEVWTSHLTIHVLRNCKCYDLECNPGPEAVWNAALSGVPATQTPPSSLFGLSLPDENKVDGVRLDRGPPRGRGGAAVPGAGRGRGEGANRDRRREEDRSAQNEWH